MDAEIIIIGAGAAGLAAARTLSDSGRSVLILEARPRIGGRVWTDTEIATIPIERGAEFIHGENAATLQLVAKSGAELVPVVRELRWSEGGSAARAKSQWSEATQKSLAQVESALSRIPDLPSDTSLEAYLKMRGLDEHAMELADVLYAQPCCATLESLSVADFRWELETVPQWNQEARLKEGYGPLLERYAQGLDIRLNQPVRLVEWAKGRVKISSENQSFQAGKCILTLPPCLLQANAIEFLPALPAAKKEAIAQFRTEPATKLIYRFRKRFWDKTLTYAAYPGLVARWWTPGYGRNDDAYLAAIVTANRARAVDALKEPDALEKGLESLSVILGIALSEIKSELDFGIRVSWGKEPFSGGGYAHLPPGAVWARKALTEPIANTLFFAGEATVTDDNPQTVHGALTSGFRAAKTCR